MKQPRRHRSSGAPAAAAPGPRAGSRVGERAELARAVLPWALAYLALLGVHLTAVSFEIGGSLGGDGVVYYLLGRALATGAGYVDLYLPGHPAHVQYPPLFPLLLAPFHLLFERPLPGMHALVAAANAAAAVGFGIWVKDRHRSLTLGLLFAAVAGTIPIVYLQSLHLLSEPIYMAWASLALLLMGRSWGRDWTWARLTLLAATVAAGYLTRTAGLGLAIAVGIALGLQRTAIGGRGWRLPAWLVFSIWFALPAGAWHLRNAIAGGGATAYVGQFRSINPLRPEQGGAGPAELAARVVSNIKKYAPKLAGDAVGPVWYYERGVAGLVLIAPLGIGLARRLRRKEREAEFFYLVSLAIVMVWPFQEARFVLPLLPLGAYYLCVGLEAMIGRVAPGRFAAKALPALAALLLLSNALVTSGRIRERFAGRWEPRTPIQIAGYGAWSRPLIDFAKYDVGFLPPGSFLPKDLLMLTDYIVINALAGELTPPGSIIVSRKPMVTYYYSGRPSAPLLHDPEAARQWEYFRAVKADYIVLGLEEDAALPAINQALAAGDGSMEVVAEIPGGRTALVKIDRERGGPRAEEGPR